MAWIAWLFSVAAPGVDPVSIVDLPMAQAWHIDHPTHHVQGLELNEENFWITSVDRKARKGWIYKVDRKTLKVAATRELTEGMRIHPGGIQLGGGGLWCPLAEYRPRSSTSILQLDPASLRTLRSIEVRDHLGAVVHLGDEGLLGCNWDSLQFLWISPDGKLREKFDNPTGVAYQDAKFNDGAVWAAGQTKIGGEKRSVVDVVSWPQRRLVRRYLLSGRRRTGGDNFSNEGFAILGASLYMLPEDGPDSTVYRFDLPEKREVAD